MTPTPELLDATATDLMTEAEAAELVMFYESVVGGEGFVEWNNRNFPDEPVPPHLMPVVEAVESARVKPIRICISLPPGFAKTTILLRLILWWLTHYPADLCAYMTHSDEAARDKSETALDWARACGIRLKGQKQAGQRNRAPKLSLWKTPEGGGFYARGFAAGAMGKRIPGLLLIDDPYKDQSEADSEPINLKLKKRLKSMARTRLQGGSIILVHTRYADDDLYGFAVEELGFESINIPAIGEDPEELGDDYVGDPLGWRKPGESAWPAQYPVEKCDGMCGHAGHLVEHMDDLDLFNSMFQGRPSGGGGGMFRKEYLPIISSAEVPDGGQVCAGYDFAYTTNETSAWSVRVKSKIVDDVLYILDVKRERVAADSLVEWVEEIERLEAGYIRDPNAKPGATGPEAWIMGEVEGESIAVDVPQDGPAGIALVQRIVATLLGITVFWSQDKGGSKKVRAMPLASHAKAKKVKLVDGPWVKEFRRELSHFPVGTFKDQVDAAVRSFKRALTYVFRGRGAIGGSRAVARKS